RRTDIDPTEQLPCPLARSPNRRVKSHVELRPHVFLTDEFLDSGHGWLGRSDSPCARSHVVPRADERPWARRSDAAAAVRGVVDAVDDTREPGFVILGSRRGLLVAMLFLVVTAPTTRPQQYQQATPPGQQRPPSPAAQIPYESPRVLGRRFPAPALPRR